MKVTVAEGQNKRMVIGDRYNDDVKDPIRTLQQRYDRLDRAGRVAVPLDSFSFLP